MNKCDLLSEHQLCEVEAIIRDFQPRSPIFRSTNGDVDVQLFEQAGRNSSVTEVSYWIAALSAEQKENILENNPDVKQQWDNEFGDRENQIVFIGKGYDKSQIEAALTACLDEKSIA